MTATATPATEREIAAALGREPEVVRTSVVRPEPALRRRDRRRRGGAAADARPPAARASRRLGDRLRPLAPQLRDAGAHAPRPRSRRRPLPRRPRAAGALGRAGGLHRGADPDRRRDDRVRDGDRQARHPARRALQLPRVARELRPDGRAGRARRPRVGHAPAREPLRRAVSCAASHAPTSRRSPISAPSTRGCAAGARCCRRSWATSRIRACSSGCWSRSGSCSRGFDAGRAMQIEVPDPPADSADADRRAPRPLRAGGAGPGRPARPLRRVAGLPAPAGRRALRRDACGGLRHVRRLLAARGARRRARCDDAAAGRHRRRDPRRRARAALAARPHGPHGDAARLDERAPVGPAFAPLRAARRGEPGGRQALDPAARALRCARVVRERRRLPPAAGCARAPSCRGSARPRPPARPTRASSSGCARGGSSGHARTRCRPTSSCTTRRCASSRPAKPANERDLAAVKGFGPTKLERYGDDVLAVIAAA